MRIAHVFGVMALSSASASAVRHEDEARRERSEVLAIRFLGTSADDRGRAAVEVVREYDDLGLICRDAFYFVSPAARELDCRLDGFGAGIHRQRFFETGKLGEFLEESSHAVVAHRSRGERDFRSLFQQRGVNARMAMSLVDRRVCADAIEVALSVDVP